MEERLQYITKSEWMHIKAGESVGTVTAPHLNGPYTLYELLDENNCHAGWHWVQEEIK